MRDALFLVGMSRSGSSALTRVLSLCGGALPVDILPANAGNPTGYWEPEALLHANERFLHAHASSWFDPRLDLQLSARADRDGAFVREAAALLDLAFEPGGPLLVKEPRISGLLPYWLAAARSCRLRSTAVLTLRHPDDIAASMMQRDGLSAEQSYALWLKYSLVAERDTRAVPRIFVSYEDLLAGWEPVVTRCAGRLDLPLAITREARTAVGAFLSPRLRHHASTRPVAGDAGGLVARTYALFERAKEGLVDSAGFDAVLAEYAASAIPPAGLPTWATAG